MLNFWDYLLAGLTAIVGFLIYGFSPTHAELGLSNAVVRTTSSAVAVLVIIVFSNFNMLLPSIAFIIWASGEGVRSVYATWRWIKRIVL